MEKRFRPVASHSTSSDPEKSARLVGLRYVCDDTPGIRRVRNGKNFRFLDPDKKTIKAPDQLGRIKSLAIPPAWKNVWICPFENGHLQATGQDDRGRKQYRYHRRWREVRDETKFNHIMKFAKALPKIRQRVQKDLRRPGTSREKVLATVIQLLEVSLIRVGNEEYARTNHSFGLTTMQDKHVQVNGSRVRFQFKGKSNKRHTIEIENKKLAKIVKRCRDLPGQDLFQFVDDDGKRQDVKSEDVNAYLREISGEDFTAKDFRTWAGTVLAAMALQEFEKFDTQAQAKRNLIKAIEAVSQRLGNTPSICKKCYVHPAIVESYFDGSLMKVLKDRAETQLKASSSRLPAEETAVLALLRQRLALKGEPLKKTLELSLRNVNTRRVAQRKTKLRTPLKRAR